MTATCLYLTKTGETYSRLWLGYSVLTSVTLLTSYRYLLFKILRINLGETNILLLGGGDDARNTIRKLEKSARIHLTVVEKFCRETPYTMDGIDQTIDAIDDYVEELRKQQSPIAEIWVMQDFFANATIIQLQKLTSISASSVVFIPQLPQHFFSEEAEIEVVAGFPAIHSNISTREQFKRFIKNLEDKVLGFIAIILTLPLWVIIAISIKLSSSGPVFYRQKRYGIHGKEFNIWKFRTMNVSDSAGEFVQAVSSDPRVTRVGRFLRRTSLDELPQLINVVGGSMSLVGPRPHPNKMNEDYRDQLFGYMQRHNVKPGITGLAQINGYRGETKTDEDMKNRIQLDLEYIKNWSLFLDFKILLLTVTHLFTTKQAY